MIDGKYQGKGYGKAALALILDYLKTNPQGDAEYVYTSIEPGNEPTRQGKLTKSGGIISQKGVRQLIEHRFLDNRRL